eukprot:Gb_14948 [translate_table: standard]
MRFSVRRMHQSTKAELPYNSLLQSCVDRKSISDGKQLHAHLLKSGTDIKNVFLNNNLVVMYTKCGAIEDARQVFEKMAVRNEFSWTAIIEGYARQEYPMQALALFYQMQKAGAHPDHFIFPIVIKVCAGLEALHQGKEIHDYLIKTGFESNVFSGSALVNMYAKCGELEDARQVFDKMPERNVVGWNALIAGYAQNGYGDQAIEFFEKMQLEGIKPNVISWNAIIAGHVQNDHGKEALKLFRQMQLAGVEANSVTMASVLPAYASFASVKEIHDYIMRCGLGINAFVGSALIGVYVKCGSVEHARHVFDKMSQRDVVSWNAMITGYAQSGQVDEALNLFHQMQLAGLKPDLITWNAMIDGYARNGYSSEALKFFQEMQWAGFKADLITWNMIIARYAQNGHGDEALKLFQQMQSEGVKPNVKSWTALIAGYSQNGERDKALKLFCQMQLAGVKPNSVTIASILPACANLAGLQLGKEIHAYAIRNGFESDLFVGSAIVDMYAKCGNIANARQVFHKMSQRNVVTWNAMISGYAMHGHGENALRLFYQMKEAGVKPDHVTFTGVLSACSHAGLVDEGWQYFAHMNRDYGIIPSMEHYACLVDLLGRAGLLDEAQEFINKMPLKPDACVWGALLGACRVHCNVELGERVAEYLFEFEPQNAGNYVLLSNIYASAGRWEDVLNVRNMMNNRGLKKEPGCSWIEVNNRVHAFLTGDKSHPQSQKIYAMLQSLAGQMEEAGYVADTSFVLWDVEEKEHILCGHSERLAIAFGLVNTCPRTSIRVIKNLRVCGDCHTATKFISKIVGREIFVRDTNRFHHFKNGLCSCGDYW